MADALKHRQALSDATEKHSASRVSDLVKQLKDAMAKDGKVSPSNNSDTTPTAKKLQAEKESKALPLHVTWYSLCQQIFSIHLAMYGNIKKMKVFKRHAFCIFGFNCGLDWLFADSSKVLNSLKKLNAEAPPPFPQSAQYQKAFKDEKGQGGEDQVPTNSKKKNAKNGKKNKKKADLRKLRDTATSKLEPAADDGEDTGSTYKAKEYSNLRKQFIAAAREDRGVSSKDAAEEWNNSSLKRKLLSALSVSELRRRRFIEKGCHHNPWADPALS